MKQFEKIIIALYGSAGRQWLTALSERVNQIAAEWNVAELKLVQDLSYNYVMAGLQENKSVVLKVGMDEAALEREARALQVYDGVGAVRLLDTLPGALLLERVLPGESLKKVSFRQESEASAIFEQVMSRLHRKTSLNVAGFPHIKDWLIVLDDARWNIPQKYISKAREMRDILLESTQQEVLLHGDLHHDNILEHSGDWVAIDPKGVVGDPAFEYAAFLRNPWPNLLEHEQVYEIIKKRLKSFSMNHKRILHWSFVQSVLAWIWACQDGIYSDSFSRFTELLYRIISNVNW